jgi:cellulase/cellobiase CelA1
LIDSRGEARELMCCRNCFGVAAKALSNEGEPTSRSCREGSFQRRRAHIAWCSPRRGLLR